jgi:ABC-type multidrug transport system permease subunit
MSFHRLRGWAGPAAIVAGALLTVSQLVMWTLNRADLVATVNSITYKITMTAYVIGFFALMVALVALYQRQALQAGTFGVVALLQP